MTRLDEALRGLDPVDPDAPVPGDDALLERILQTPYGVAEPAARRARRPRRAPLALLAAACVAAAALVLTLPHGTRTDALAAAYRAVSDPDTVLHYREHWLAPGTSVSPRQDLEDVEIWQAGDGSRGRALERIPAQEPQPGVPGFGPITSEHVWSSQGTRAWNSNDKDTIIVYDARYAPRRPSPGAAYIPSRQIGDPRTLLARARDGDAQVIRLPDGAVRGIPVLRFRVGRCKLTRTGPGAFSLRYAAVVSIGRDSHLPVRVEQPPCHRPPPGQKGLKMEEMPGFTVDYLSFEVLPADAAHARLLDMAPHPGAKLVDGHAIDEAEERADRAASRRRRGSATVPAGARRGATRRGAAGGGG